MYRHLQGYGFILRDGEGDVFFHRTDLLQEYEPKEGDRVEFDLEEQSDGRFQAKNVKPIE